MRNGYSDPDDIYLISQLSRNPVSYRQTYHKTSKSYDLPSLTKLNRPKKVRYEEISDKISNCDTKTTKIVFIEKNDRQG